MTSEKFAYAIREIPPAETLPLRHKILRPHQSPEDCIFPGDDNPRSFHLAVFANGVTSNPMSIASFLYDAHAELPEPKYQFRIRGMATEEEHRGKGYGRALVDAGLRRMKEDQAVIVWCNAREVALEFYRKSGFEVFGELFDIEGIGPHAVMWRWL